MTNISSLLCLICLYEPWCDRAKYLWIQKKHLKNSFNLILNVECYFIQNHFLITINDQTIENNRIYNHVDVSPDTTNHQHSRNQDQLCNHCYGTNEYTFQSPHRLIRNSNSSNRYPHSISHSKWHTEISILINL